MAVPTGQWSGRVSRIKDLGVPQAPAKRNFDGGMGAEGQITDCRAKAGSRNAGRKPCSYRAIFRGEISFFGPSFLRTL